MASPTRRPRPAPKIIRAELFISPSAERMSPTVTYWAVSILSSRTAQFAGLTMLLGILSLPEVLALIPLRYMPLLLALVGVINLGLRKLTVRPVAFIAPGTTKPMRVPKIAPPAPPLMGD